MFFTTDPPERRAIVDRLMRLSTSIVDVRFSETSGQMPAVEVELRAGGYFGPNNIGGLEPAIRDALTPLAHAVNPGGFWVLVSRDDTVLLTVGVWP